MFDALRIIREMHIGVQKPRRQKKKAHIALEQCAPGVARGMPT